MRMHGQGSNINNSTYTLPTNELTLITGDPICYSFNCFNQCDHLVHAIFTRKGGTSSPPFQSLNVGQGLGDESRNVFANMEKIKARLGASFLIYVDQIHGNGVVQVHRKPDTDISNLGPADALITCVPNIAMMIKLADCQGVIIHDPENGVTGLVHCGWRGNVKNILGRVVDSMNSSFGCNPEKLIAGIGPSLGPCCGEFKGWKQIFPEGFERFRIRHNYYDLWQLSCQQLEHAGLRQENIHVAGICTRCTKDLFFSYRAEGQTGRFAMVAMIKD